MIAESIRAELRQAVRSLGARPLFALSVIATLALGIGANTAVFSAIEGLLLKPLPYPDSARLVAIENVYPKRNDESAGMTVPDYLDRRAQAPALADSAIYFDYSYDLADAGGPERLSGVATTPSLFTTLGVEARLGRTFAAEEGEPGGEDVVLLSDGLWRDRFGADPGIVGRVLHLSGRSYRVVGVMPAEFAFPRREVRLWVPFVFTEKQKSDAMRGFGFASSVGRLAPGATIAELDSQFDAIVQRNLERLGGDGSDFRARVAATGFTGRARDLHDRLVGDRGTLLWLLQAAALLMLAVASANVANLLLVRASARRRELAVRAALGASRGRIARQLLLEALLLALGGAVAGIAVAIAGMALIRGLGLDGRELGFGVALDPGVLAAALLGALASGVAVGMVPAFAVGRDLAGGIGAVRGTGGAHGSGRARRVLVVAQIALAATLLTGSGLLLRSYWQVQRQSPGFAPEHLLTANVNLSRERFRDGDAARRFESALLPALRALPGVRAAGVVGGMPFTEDYGSNPCYVDGRDPAAPELSGYLQTADEAFFGTMGIPLLRGRGFEPGDVAGALPVAIIDEALATTAFGKADPIGRRLGTRGLHGIEWRTIVGVVGSVKRHALSEREGADTYYFPYAQAASRIFRIAIRTDPDAGDLRRAVREAVARIDPEQPVWGLVTMEEHIDRSLDGRRTPLALLLGFAAVAVGLGAIGLYGVMAYGVAQRRGEIGVRMSLGADAGAIVVMVMGEGARLLVPGLALGAALALLLSFAIRSQLFDVAATDPATFALALSVVALIALCACFIPARWAARVSPSEALRGEEG